MERLYQLVLVNLTVAIFVKQRKELSDLPLDVLIDCLRKVPQSLLTLLLRPLDIQGEFIQGQELVSVGVECLKERDEVVVDEACDL